MTFPRHVLAVLDRFGVRPETKVALADLYLAMGSEVLESFADLTAGPLVASEARPEDLSGIREALIRRFLARSHPEWLAGQPTRSFWHPRAAEGHAAGLLAPIGRSDGSAVDAFSTSVFERVRAIVGSDQPVPEGILLFGKNAHFGGRAETVSFDVVPADPGDAMAVALAEGRQHTVPGSVGETSGTADSERSLLLLWEIQPNVLKPQGERNRAIGPIFRRHRNWHVTTLVLALRWAEVRKLAIYILKGEALAATHEVNRHQPVTPEVEAMYERTIQRVAVGMGYRLEPAGGDDERLLLDSELMNTGLRQRVESEGSAGAIWRLEPPAASQGSGVRGQGSG